MRVRKKRESEKKKEKKSKRENHGHKYRKEKDEYVENGNHTRCILSHSSSSSTVTYFLHRTAVHIHGRERGSGERGMEGEKE